MKKLFICIVLLSFLCCENDDNIGKPSFGGGDDDPQNFTCSSTMYPDWSTSQYVLPYSVGESYYTGLTACSSAFHAPGQPDQFAIDFDMPIGSQIRASAPGTVVYVEESGVDFSSPNNVVIVSSGSVFVQYMHLTQNGAEVSVGQYVEQGEVIGYSGATGLAGYPHLHFVITEGQAYPYQSLPVTFRNTSPNPLSLESGISYLALPFF